MLNEDGMAMVFDRPDAALLTESAPGRVPSRDAVAISADIALPARSRYGDQRGFNMSAFGITAALHVLIVLALLTLGVQVTRKQEAHLVAFNLSAPPPPPSPEKAQPQKLSTAVEQPVLPVAVVPPATIPLATAPAPAQYAPEPVTEPVPPAAPAPPSMMSSNNLGTKMLSGNPPHYPTESRRQREQGTVVLSLILGIDGKVSSISIAHSSGFPRLDNAALHAVRSWRWSPTSRDGQPVMVKGVVEIPFVLQG